MRNILITGGAGFIGSNFIEYFMDKYRDYNIINLDLLTYAGNLDNLSSVATNPDYTFIKGDICDINLVKNIFRDYNITDVIHFAAQSHVDNSIKTPDIFVKTNINGTFNLLHCAYLSWFDAPFTPKESKKNCIFHHISTDEVFGSLGDSGYFTEDTPYAPNSPYSASKASSDMLVRSYHHTYGLNTFITNCSNNYGPKQHAEKLIPTIIHNALEGKNIPIYGDGKNIRDWLYVLDHCKGIDAVFHSKFYGETFNIGGNSEKTNLEVVGEICDILDRISPRSDGASYANQITFVKDRAGHDRRYAIDCSKIAAKLGWNPKESFADGIHKTVEWYLGK
ncbi:dTDP-glucose 4,6-dehydratase [Campylobacter sp. CLAX-22107-21]|uniref:dTDP-glucose 4,6-dehydratase n=1 Tax=Campylobacter devanensis TaxID=3161138 RepID=UPI002E984C43|nr:dTDP-glucose 4,6-dehydratase [Campylobacter sp. CLAX-22107-21]